MNDIVMSDAKKCTNCGNNFYEIRLVMRGMRDDLFVVQCSGCSKHLIPVKVSNFTTQKEINDACLSAWNEANPQQETTP